MDITRKLTRRVMVGSVPIGGGSPLSVQTMTRSPWKDIDGNLAEIATAAKAGADIIRMAVPSVEAAASLARIAEQSILPIVADTHFDWRVTLAAIEAGAAKVRINPGNMNPGGLARVVEAAGKRNIPIRIGGNSGSIRHRKAGDAAEASLPELLAEEALLWSEKVREMGFHDLVLSIKANSAIETVTANRIVAARSDLPLHLGVTAAGTKEDSIMKSAAAVGSLILDGIGDTIRFSFTGDLEGEVRAGVDLLRSLGLRNTGPEIVSCPACGRCRVDLPGLAGQVKERLAHIAAPLRVAVMGCEVNGPGEAKDCDLGIASAGGIVHLFIKGEVVGRVAVEEAVNRLCAEAEKMAEQYGC
jgi:1-hydroxy-2-methyl-2-(E)-butenyl 4-diphosphate synthase